MFEHKFKRVIDPDKVQEKLRKEHENGENIPLEKGDKKAIFLAAFLTFLPFCLAVIGVLVLIALLFFFRT